MIHLLQVESRLAVELRLEQRPGSGKNRGCPKGGPKILVYNIFTYIIYVQDRRGLLRSAASSLQPGVHYASRALCCQMMTSLFEA